MCFYVCNRHLGLLTEGWWDCFDFLSWKSDLSIPVEKSLVWEMEILTSYFKWNSLCLYIFYFDTVEMQEKSSGNRTFPVYRDVKLSCMKKHGGIALGVIEKRCNHMLLWKDDFAVWLLNCFLLECYQITRWGTSSLWSLSESSLNQHSVWIPPSAEVTQMTVVNGCG